MNYVPFGEKALTMVVNLYQETAHNISVIQFNILHSIIEVYHSLQVQIIQGCIQKFLDWLPGARTANGTALCH
jgi:hypothetical protein